MRHRSGWICSLVLAGALGLDCTASHPPVELVLVPPATDLPVPGEQLVLSVRSRGGRGTLAYQWFKDDRPIPGATGTTLALGPLVDGDFGAYWAQVTDGVVSARTDPFDILPAERAWTVTSIQDDGPGTLRQVLAEANAAAGSNGIGFDLPGPPPWRIELQSDLPPVTGRVCIVGPYAGALTVDGSGKCRPFFIGGGSLALEHFTVAGGLGKGGDGTGGGGGAAGMGGGLFIYQGEVVLRRMLFQGNLALGGSSAPGGDGENGGGGGFGGDNPDAGGKGADGGDLLGVGGSGHLDGTLDGNPGAFGLGAGGGAARGGLLTTLPAGWKRGLKGGPGIWGGGGGFSVGPSGIGGKGGFGGGGGGSGGSDGNGLWPGGAGGLGGGLAGDGVPGDGTRPGQGGGGAGLGGAVFLRGGTLALYDCRFEGNRALPGEGADPGFGKGGALFIFENPYPEGGSGSYSLAELRAQSYSGNVAADPVPEDHAFDSNDYYVAQQPLTTAAWRDGELGRVHRRLRRMGRPGAAGE